GPGSPDEVRRVVSGELKPGLRVDPGPGLDVENPGLAVDQRDRVECPGVPVTERYDHLLEREEARLVGGQERSIGGDEWSLLWRHLGVLSARHAFGKGVHSRADVGGD